MNNAPTPTSFHRLRHTPLIDVLRGRVTARFDWHATIARSELPPPLRGLVTQVVRRTKLWPSECMEVAQELIAHFHGGLTEGRSPENLAEAFGDPKTAAKLIRRGKVRNRSLAWHVTRRSAQALGVFIAIYAVAVLVLLAFKPRPTVDYLAMVNEVTTRSAPEDRAWPIYKPEWARHRVWDARFFEPMYVNSTDPTDNFGKQKSVKPRRVARPGDPSWPRAAEYLERTRSLVDATRLGSAKPVFGIGPAVQRMSTEDCVLLCGPYHMEYGASDRKPSNALRSAVWPVLIRARQFAQLMELDFHDAVGRGDGERALSDYRAIHGLARQARGSGMVIEQLTAWSIITLGNDTAADLLTQHPDLWTDAQLAEITGLARQTREHGTITMKAEELWAFDFIQRSFTDTGGGGGWLAPSRWSDSDEMFGSHVSAGQRFMIATAAPMWAVFAPGRREATQAVRESYDQADRFIQMPLWELIHDEAGALGRTFYMTEKARSIRFRPLQQFMVFAIPAIVHARQQAAKCEAFSVAVALERYRRERGRYPDSPAALAPDYLPEAPLDHSTGLPLLMKLVDGKPLLYGRGQDGKDDGGVEGGEKLMRSPEDPPAKGDWILYPPRVFPEAPEAGTH